MSKCENCLSKNVCRWYENGTGKNLCCADDFPCPEQKDKDHFIKVPCKVGDTVYVKNRPLIISFLHIEDEVYYVIQFDCDDCGDCPFYEDDVSFEGEHDCKTMGYIQFTGKDIGKTVFLTKEEAEEKLKELKDNARDIV